MALPLSAAASSLNSAGPQKAITQDKGKVFFTVMLVTPPDDAGKVAGALVAGWTVGLGARVFVGLGAAVRVAVAVGGSVGFTVGVLVGGTAVTVDVTVGGTAVAVGVSLGGTAVGGIEVVVMAGAAAGAVEAGVAGTSVQPIRNILSTRTIRTLCR